MTATVTQMGRRTSFTDDAAGRQLTVQNPAFETVTTTYDNDNRVTFQVFPKDTGVGTDSYSYGYDPNGNRALVVDPSGTTTYTFEDANRLSTQEGPPGGKPTTYSYDGDNRQTAKAISGIGTFTYGHDDASRQTSIADAHAGITTIIFDDAGQMIQRMLPNGVVSIYQYDASGCQSAAYHTKNESLMMAAGVRRAARMLSLDDVELLAGFGYNYTDAGVRAQRTDLVTGDKTLYSLDASNQVQGESTGPLSWYNIVVDEWSALGVDDWSNLLADGSTPVFSSVYDATGNALTITDASGTSTFTYDVTNRIETIVGPSGITTFTYDDSGQLLTRQAPLGATTTYTWDGDGRLIKAELPGSAVFTLIYEEIAPIVHAKIACSISSIIHINMLLVAQPTRHQRNSVTSVVTPPPAPPPPPPPPAHHP